MVKKYAKLTRIDNDHQITPDADAAFLYQLQHGLLLALKDQGKLNVMQYRYAAEKLCQQEKIQVRNSHKNLTGV